MGLFWIGLIVGLIAGAGLGLLAIALVIAAIHPETAD
jgi:hypothetical protein